MTETTSRRAFLRSTSVAGVALGLGKLPLVTALRPVSDAEARWNPAAVRLDPRIESLIRLLEKTPRDRVLEEFAARIEAGTTYAEVLAAVLLAGVRNIPPRPDVGFKFHCVLVVNSVHLASRALPPEDRWLPIFFALDFFKGQQAYDERESDWSLGPVDEAAVPRKENARAAFVAAMDDWDDLPADAAVAGLVRTARPKEVFELFAHYGMRDFRNIGHKSIYMAGAWRLLQTIGWRHAEPVMRSLAYALLNHHDEPNPAHSELEADAPWRHDLELVDEIGDDWRTGEISATATTELLSTLRTGTWPQASAHVAELLGASVSPQSVLDGLFCGAAELLMRQPGIVSLHAMTTTNALAYAFRTSTTDRTRRLLLLQNAAFLVQFRDALKKRGKWRRGRIDRLEPTEPTGDDAKALAEIFARVNTGPSEAARKILAYLQPGGRRAEEFMTAARRLSILKCKNGHDYKFSSAVFEDYARISPAWRDRYLAASVHYLRGTDDTDNKVVQRTRDAFRA